MCTLPDAGKSRFRIAAASVNLRCRHLARPGCAAKTRRACAQIRDAPPPAALGCRLRRRPTPSRPASPAAAAFNSLPLPACLPTQRVCTFAFRFRRRRIGWRRAGGRASPSFLPCGGASPPEERRRRPMEAPTSRPPAAHCHALRLSTSNCAVSDDSLFFSFFFLHFDVSCWSRLDLIKSQRVRRCGD